MERMRDNKNKFFKYLLIIILAIFTILRSLIYFFTSIYVCIRINGPQSFLYKEAFRKLGFNEPILFIGISTGIIVNILYIITSMFIIKLHNKGRIFLISLLLFSLLSQLFINILTARVISFESIINYCFFCISLFTFTRKSIVNIFLD